MHGEGGQDLPVDFEARQRESVHERAVAHSGLRCRRIDTRDPQLAEITLLRPAIAVPVLPAALDGLLRGLPQLRAAAVGTARRLHDALLPLQARNVRSSSWHGIVSLGLQQALDGGRLSRRHDVTAAEAT